MMNNKLLILFALGLSVLLSGCLKEDTCSNPSGEEGTLRLTLSIGDPKDVQTRSEASSDERWINNLVVLVFDKNSGRYKDGEIIMGGSESLSGNNGDQSRILTSTLIPSIDDKLVLLVNVADVSSIPLQKGISTTDDINHVFNMGVLNPLMAGYGLPMSGEIRNYNPGASCIITRSVAKIQLALAPELSQPENDVTGTFFSGAEGIRWGMSACLSDQMGAVYAPDVWECVVKPGVELEFPGSGLDYSVVGATGTDVFYMPEYPAAGKAKITTVDVSEFHADRTCMLVQVSGKYYRLDLFDHGTKNYIDIRRNTHITVTIKKVKSAGYATAEEAVGNPGSNLEYEIHVKGGEDDIVTSNGQYAIAVSETSLDIFGNAGEYEITTVRYILPAEMASLPSEITNNISVANGNITLISGSSLTDTATPIRIKVTKSTGPAALTIKLGNIQQQISIILHDTPADAHTSIRSLNLVQLAGYDIKPIRWNRNDNNVQADLVRSGKNVNLELFFPENVTLTGWEDDQHAPSLQTNPNSVPVFKDQIADFTYFREGPAGPWEYMSARIIFKQLAPDYAGWWGGEPAGTVPGNAGVPYFDKRLIVERIQESQPIPWSSGSGLSGSTDIERGLANTRLLMEKGNKQNFEAAYNCYMKNDLNLNGVIDLDEPIGWYLPARNQLLGLYCSHGNMNSPFNDQEYVGHWCSTERVSNTSFAISFFTGNMDVAGSKANKCYVRCVKEM